MADIVPEFPVPVDSEHKSKVLKIWSFGKPHHRAFQLSWMSFFVAFFATFAAPPLIPIIRDDLDLTKPDLGNAALASVVGAVFSRVVMGTCCDVLGPRYGHSVVHLLTCTATFAMATVSNVGGFIACRMLIGFSLATFVSCQFWCSTMFSARIVGSANAVAAGWGNMGAGVTHILMPYIFSAIGDGVPEFVAWRVSYWIPAFAQIAIALAVLTLGQDLPDGNYYELERSGAKDKDKSHAALWAAVRNYRTWLMTLSYAFCFGVELTVDNNIAPYLYDQFSDNLDLHTASLLGAVFGMSNLFARALGGVVSDAVARRYGMRGRLWTLWLVQSLAGMAVALMYVTRDSLGLTGFVIALMALFIPMSCGASFGVAPFITRRGLGVASGFIGAGGSAGGAFTQAVYFTPNAISDPEGFKLMGCTIVGVTALLSLLHFPMWGSMFLPPLRGHCSEDEYYCSDFTEDEKKQGLHRAVLNFASESRSQRGFEGGANLKAILGDEPSTRYGAGTARRADSLGAGDKA